MKLVLNSNLVRKAALLIAPMGLLGGGSLYAQDSYHEDEHARWHHQHDEKHALKHHQRDERDYYGNSWELRQHQREEPQQLRYHHEDERGYGDQYNRYGGNDRGYYGRDRGDNGGGYSGRPY